MKIAEGIWARIFRKYLINKPIELFITKPTSNPRKSRPNRNDRINEHKIHIVNWRKYVNLLNHSDTWKNWPLLALINLLVHLKQAKLENEKLKSATFLIKNHIKIKYLIRLK